mmetsp:Transcript_13293/g.23546  ORF Transcript_13293/g.23546 Transcript_13293/m.23546 type:complete len:96 (-) Transcript_13293:204-491(-)
MKVRGKVKIFCDGCVRSIVRVAQNKHIVLVECSKNPRHKQRSKFARFSTLANASESPSFISSAVNSLSSIRSLLGSQQVSTLGESFWRKMLVNQQ